MPLFCLPTSSAKLKKSSISKASEQTATNANHNNNGQHHQQINTNDSIATTTLSNRHLLRYVTVEFHAKVNDELTVMPDDVVLFEYDDPTGEWSHVWSIRAGKSGYVPSKILTELRQISSARRKKMPRNETNRLEMSSRHLHHHSSHHHVSGPAVSSSGDNSRLSDHPLNCGQHHHQHLSNIPHSFQGSASQDQTFSRFHDISMVESPVTYYNLRAPNHCQSSYDLGYEQFLTRDFGSFVVINNFVAREENDLEVTVGDIVKVLNKDDDDWYWVQRECDSKEGFVPAKFIKDRLSIESALTKDSTLSMKSSNLNQSINHPAPTYSNQMETFMPDQQQQLSSCIPLVGV